MEAEGRLYRLPAQRQSHCVFSKEIATVYMSGLDGRWQQFDTTCILIGAPQWHQWTVRVKKMLPVKANLAICSPVTGVSGYSGGVWLSC